METEEIYRKIDKVNKVRKKIERFGNALTDATNGKGRDEAIFAEMGLLGVQMLLITNMQTLNEILTIIGGCSQQKELYQMANSMRDKIQREYTDISSLIKDLGI